MTYEFQCDACDNNFITNVPLDERNTPLTQPCPKCGATQTIRRVFGSTITHDTMDVQTRARKVSGEAYTEVMTRIQKHSGKYNTVRV